MRTLVTHRPDRSRPLDWIQIGAVAGPDVSLPSAALRAEISSDAFTVDADSLALGQVETAWNAAVAPGPRVVFTP